MAALGGEGAPRRPRHLYESNEAFMVTNEIFQGPSSSASPVSVFALIPLCDVNARDLEGTNALGAAITHECDPKVMAALLAEGVDERRCKGEWSAMELVLQTHCSRAFCPGSLRRRGK